MSQRLGFDKLEPVWASISSCPHGPDKHALNALALRERRPSPKLDADTCASCPYNATHPGRSEVGCISSVASQTLSELGKLLKGQYPAYKERIQQWAEAREWKAAPIGCDEAAQILVVFREVLAGLECHPEWIAQDIWRSAVKRYLFEAMAFCNAAARLHHDLVIPT